MSEVLDLEDIDDIDVIELSGKLWSSLKPEHVNVELRMEASIDEDAADSALAFITLYTTVRNAADDDDDNDADSHLRTTIYEGTTSLIVSINNVINDQNNDTWRSSIAQIAWPYLRSATVEHAHRLNAPELGIPIVLPHARASADE